MRDASQLTDFIGFHIGYVSSALKSALSNVLRLSGEQVTAAQLPIMVMLWQQNGRNQNELSTLLHKDKTAITRNIDLLEEHNLIIRVQDKTDRRNNFVYLTRKGKDLEETLVPYILDFIKVISKNIEPTELENMNRTLRKIHKNINELS